MFKRNVKEDGESQQDLPSESSIYHTKAGIFAVAVHKNSTAAVKNRGGAESSWLKF